MISQQAELNYRIKMNFAIDWKLLSKIGFEYV